MVPSSVFAKLNMVIGQLTQLLSYNKDYSDLTSNIVEREPKITPLNKGLIKLKLRVQTQELYSTAKKNTQEFAANF